MEPSASRHVPELDGLRGIAIICVLVHHQLTPFSLKGGFLGVDLFFVLSGFLITRLLLSEFEKTGSISLKNFYMRRLLRLGPALFLYLVACFFVTYYTKLIDLGRQIKLIALALVYSTNWRMAFGWDPSMDPTAIIWSLSIEEQFYLVWPLLFVGSLALKFKPRIIAAGLVVVITFIMVHRYLLLTAGADLTRLYYGTDTRADALLVGCVFGLLPLGIGLSRKKWLRTGSVVAAAGFIYLTLAVEFSDTFLYQGGFTGIALLAGTVIAVAATSPPRILSAVLRWPPLLWFGRISYGLYLWHWLVVRSTSFYYLGYWEPWAKLALALGIASVSFYLVEKPFNRLKNRFAAPDSASRTGTGSVKTEPPLSPLGIPVAS